MKNFHFQPLRSETKKLSPACRFYPIQLRGRGWRGFGKKEEEQKKVQKRTSSTSAGGSLSKSTHAACRAGRGDGRHGNEIGFFFPSFFGPLALSRSFSQPLFGVTAEGGMISGGGGGERGRPIIRIENSQWPCI